MILLLSLLAAPLLLVTAFFAVEVAAGLRRGDPQDGEKAPRARAVVVVPAHDEAATVEGALRALIAELGADTTILLVADNCADDTAAIARSIGIETIERRDHERRGKGFALAFAKERLRADPPEIVLVLDADCAMDGTSIEALIGACATSGRPCQAVNLLRAKEAGSPMVELSNFAFMLKNLVRQRGLQRLARSVHLTGTGMAMPWPLFAAADLATASVVEDVKLGLELTEAGTPPMLVEGATVWSASSDTVGTLVQRQRWEGGNLTLAAAVVPSLIARAISRADLRLLVRAMDFLVPPLTILVLLDGLLALIIAVIFALSERGGALLGVIAVVDGAAILAIAAAWAIDGREVLRARTLLAVPGYMLWKLPLYARLRRHGAKEWLRAGR